MKKILLLFASAILLALVVSDGGYKPTNADELKELPEGLYSGHLMGCDLEIGGQQEYVTALGSKGSKITIYELIGENIATKTPDSEVTIGKVLAVFENTDDKKEINISGYRALVSNDLIVKLLPRTAFYQVVVEANGYQPYVFKRLIYVDQPQYYISGSNQAYKGDLLIFGNISLAINKGVDTKISIYNLYLPATATVSPDSKRSEVIAEFNNSEIKTNGDYLAYIPFESLVEKGIMNGFYDVVVNVNGTISSFRRKFEIDRDLAWESINGQSFWYENGTKQGMKGDPKNIKDVNYGSIERGREIFDPDSNAWYWLDAVYNGAKAVNKEVWMPYIYSNEDTLDINTIDNLARESDTYTESNITAIMSEQIKKAIANKDGKWVRYNSEGKMIKGWYTVQSQTDTALYPNQIGNTYYYDYRTGLMAKGETIIDGVTYYFDEITGVLQGNE